MWLLSHPTSIIKEQNVLVYLQNGQNKMKFNTILLPPDTHQFTIKDRLYDENFLFNQIVDYFLKLKNLAKIF